MQSQAIAEDLPIFDPRYNSLLLNFTYRHIGGTISSRDVTLQVTDGEGQTWLDTPTLPLGGTISDAKIVIASENYPRYAPLTLTLTGADLRFKVRQSRLINFSFAHANQTMLRLLCTGLWSAANRYELYWPNNQELEVRRISVAGNLPTTKLKLSVLQGELSGRSGGDRKGLQNLVKADTVSLRPSNDVIKLQLHGAKLVLDVRGGQVRRFGFYDSQGPVANLNLIDGSGAGASVTASLLDTLG